MTILTMEQISRRSFLLKAGLFAACVALPKKARSALSRENPPNIVLILSDDHSVPFLGCYGYPIKTPNLNRFAKEGLQFDKAFTSAPQCAPSRASLMTGRSPVSARLSRFSSPLPPDVPTLPELLRQKEYSSGVCRRYYHLDGAMSLKKSPSYRNILEKHNLMAFGDKLDYVNVTPGTERRNTPKYVNEFLDQVPNGKPFFLWVSFNDPHFKWD